jgi:hypothetical protein
VTADGVPDEVTAPRRGRWSWLGGGWLAWRRWRRTRPFWGALLLVCSGSWILATVKAPLPVILHIGPQGVAAFVVPLLILVAGLLLWFNPQQRLFYAIIGLLMSLASWVTSNLGGFFVGLVLGMVGGSLAFSWTPNKQPRERRRRDAVPPPVEPEPNDDAGMDLVTERSAERPVR